MQRSRWEVDKEADNLPSSDICSFVFIHIHALLAFTQSCFSNSSCHADMLGLLIDLRMVMLFGWAQSCCLAGHGHVVWLGTVMLFGWAWSCCLAGHGHVVWLGTVMLFGWARSCCLDGCLPPYASRVEVIPPSCCHFNTFSQSWLKMPVLHKSCRRRYGSCIC